MVLRFVLIEVTFALASLSVLIVSLELEFVEFGGFVVVTKHPFKHVVTPQVSLLGSHMRKNEKPIQGYLIFIYPICNSSVGNHSSNIHS